MGEGGVELRLETNLWNRGNKEKHAHSTRVEGL